MSWFYDHNDHTYDNIHHPYLDKHGAVDIISSQPWVFCAEQHKFCPSQQENHCCYVAPLLKTVNNIWLF